MNTLIYVLFYIITALMLISYLFKEKLIVSYIDKFSDFFVNKLKIDKLNLSRNFLYIINALFLLNISFITLKINFGYDEVLPIKNKVMFLSVIINFIVFLVIYIKKNYLTGLLIFNTILLVFGRSMIGIDDIYFTYLIIASIVYLMIYIIFDSENEKKISFRRYFNTIYVILLVVVIQSYYLGNYVIPTGSMEPTILVGDRIFANNIVYKFKNPKVGDIIAFKEPLDNKTMYTKRITGSFGDSLRIDENSGTLYLNSKDSNLGRKYSVDGLLKLFGNPEIYIPKKGDNVKLKNIVMYDETNNQFSLITNEEFLKMNISEDLYKDIFGLFNTQTPEQVSKLTKFNLNGKRFTYILTDSNDRFILPILDFKYSKNDMKKLLNNEEITLTDDYYMAMGDNTTNSNDSRFFGYVKKSRIYGRLLVRWYPLNRLGFIGNE